MTTSYTISLSDRPAKIEAIQPPSRLAIPQSQWVAATTESNSASSMTQITPPSTPIGSSPAANVLTPSRLAQFHNFMRAFYNFRPMASLSIEDNEASVTVTLKRGDVILIHSVQPNGWADGTVLSSGARGWLPTNYCEPFEHATIHGLLNAVTHVWDYARLQAEQITTPSSGQDYAHGMIAGVRRFLERSRCLRGDSPLVQHHDGIRRTRKGLLGDLASFRTAAARFEANSKQSSASSDSSHDLLDDIVYKSFKVVLRAVKFLDSWAQDYRLGDYHDAGERNSREPPSPPPDVHQGDEVEGLPAGPLPKSGERNRPAYGPRTSSMRWSHVAGQTLLPPARQDTSDAPRQISASHRLSCIPQALVTPSNAFASARLQSAHDAFLGHVGSFIGLHIQSRRSEDVLMNTQQSVLACKSLLAVVADVAERDESATSELSTLHEEMLTRLGNLVQSTRDMFRNIQSADETNYLVNDRDKDMVAAATACVTAAGDCVSKTRQILERIGDFEVYHGGLKSTSPQETAAVETRENGVPKSQPLPTNEASKSWPACDPGRLLAKASKCTMSIGINGNAPHAASFRTTTQFDFPTLQVEIPMLSPIMLQMSPRQPDFRPVGSGRPDSMGASVAGSNRTFSASVRSSENDCGSQVSTRATSLDKSPKDAKSTRTALSNRDSLVEMQASSGEPEEVEAQLLGDSHTHELAFNKEGQIVGGSIAALVERLTTHDSTPDATFVSAFFMTFRLFTSPLELTRCLTARFETAGDRKSYADPVRLRVFNVFKQWMEGHWQHDTDHEILPVVLDFAEHKVKAFLPSAGKRLSEICTNLQNFEGRASPQLLSAKSRTTSTLSHVSATAGPTPAPIITKQQLSLLRNHNAKNVTCSVMDFDPVEIARQLTLSASALYCAIRSDELLASEWTKQSGSKSVHVRAMSTMATDLANLVADTILQCCDAKRRAVIIKHWVKIAAQCFELNNFDSLMAIVCSLNSSMVVRLSRTWDLVSAKTTARLEMLKSAVNVAKNHASLRNRLQMHVGPCVPFVGMYLTDLTFVDAGNQSTRQLLDDGASRPLSVINFDKYMKTARIISELQRFQMAYALTAVPELREWLESQTRRVRTSEDCSVQNYYRRSLLLEPRKTMPGVADNASTRAAARDRFDFWTSLTFQAVGGLKEKA